MKVLKITMLFLIVASYTPSFAGSPSKRELRKERRKFTKKVRAIDSLSENTYVARPKSAHYSY